MKQTNQSIHLKNFVIGGNHRFVLIAGPCVVESRSLTLQTTEHIKQITDRLHIPFIFKSSYKKANRTSGKSFIGLELEKALNILAEVKKTFDVPILTDIHTEQEAAIAAEVADVIQIPAFLCRQTELLHAAGKTGKIVNIKKGQFMAPEDMRLQAEKVVTAGTRNVMLTERGATFGYHNLVVDMRSLVIMRKTGCPVILDATHSVQLPGGEQTSTGGQPEFIAPLARAGAGVGIDGLFIETHPNPARAKSDAASQLPLSSLERLLYDVLAIDMIVKAKHDTR